MRRFSVDKEKEKERKVTPTENLVGYVVLTDLQ